MIVNMLQKMGIIVLLLTAGFLIGCETSTLGPMGSKHQTQNGISETGYPGGQPVDAQSPALSSSTEQNYSHPIVATGEPQGEDSTPVAK